MPAKCRPSTQILPATCAWVLLLTCTAIFFGCASKFFATNYSPAIVVYEGLLSIFVVLNFGLATFMDPGSYPPAREDEVKAGTGDQRAPLYKSVDIDGVVIRMKWCSTCQFYRPPRCSHCGVCDTCIEAFDHHCPWVNNCIGRSNYRFFFQFLVSLTLDMFSLFALSLTYVIYNKDNIVSAACILLIIVIVIIGVTCIPVIGLTCFHIILISKGKTTNEQIPDSRIERVKAVVLVTGKLKGGHNPFTRGCFLNFQYTLCGPIWPRLTGRERKSISALDPDSIRLIYQSSVNRVYLENPPASARAGRNGIKTSGTVPVRSGSLPSKTTSIGKDLSVTMDSHLDHSTPFSSPRASALARPHEDDDVPLGGSAHSMTVRSHSGHSLTGNPQLSAPSVSMFTSIRQSTTSTDTGHPTSADSSQHRLVPDSSSRAMYHQIKPSGNGITQRPASGSLKKKVTRRVDGEMGPVAPIALAEELTPSPTATGFELTGVSSSLIITAGPAAVIHTSSLDQKPSLYKSRAMTSAGRPVQTSLTRPDEGKQTVGVKGQPRTEQQSNVNSSWKKRQAGRVKPVTHQGGGYVNEGGQEAYMGDDLDEVVSRGVGTLPGSIRRPRSFARALEGGDQLPAAPRGTSREGLESVGETEELDETHPSILEISV